MTGGLGRLWCIIFGHQWKNQGRQAGDLPVMFYCPRCNRSTVADE